MTPPPHAVELLKRIAEKAGVEPQALGHIATVLLRELHLHAVSNPNASTGTAIACNWVFGSEACFHLGGILAHHDYNNSDLHGSGSDVPETMRRFFNSDDLDELKRQWQEVLDKGYDS